MQHTAKDKILTINKTVLITKARINKEELDVSIIKI